MFPTLIRIGDFQLATYGVFVAAGYMAGILWLSSRQKRIGLSERQFWGLIYSLFFGAVFGGKILYWIVEWRDVLSGDLRLVRDFRFGFVFYGGVIGAALMGAWYQRREKFSYAKVADYFAVALPLGHAVGRLGCFAAGCCAGSPTQMPWGVRFSHPEALVASHWKDVPLHPTQIYESLLNVLVALAAYRVLSSVEAGRLPKGSAGAAYLGCYGAVRFGLEFLRGDDRGGFFLGLSPSQWIAAAAVALSAALAVRLRRRAS